MSITGLLYNLGITTNRYYYDLDFDFLSYGQLISKDWLIDELSKIVWSLGNTYILCGWYCLTASLIHMNQYLSFKSITSFDIDEKSNEIAKRLNNFDNFNAETKDIFDIDFKIPDTIINTACEHTDPSWYNEIPSDKVVILQSNNANVYKEHINCMDSLDEFKDCYPMKTILFEGTFDLPLYKRYMIIGSPYEK